MTMAVTMMSVARVGCFVLRTVIMRDVLAHPLMIATVALTCAGYVPNARAQDASSWDGEPHGSSRLIAGAAHNTGDKKLARAGIEIRLDPGWKTYWRYPGDTGVPPTLDFAGSESVKSVRTLWPVPRWFAESVPRFTDRLSRRCGVAAANHSKRFRQAIVAARQARLRGLRKAVRAGRGAAYPDAFRQAGCRRAGIGRG